MEHPYLFWIGFHILILTLLFIDLKGFHSKSGVIKSSHAVKMTCGWILLALLFNGFIYFELGPEAGLQFFTGYLIEKSLSIDNLFVFLLIFSYFKIHSRAQHRVLYWGILGAICFRILLILAGVRLIQQFQWITLLLGAVLILTGIKFVLSTEKEIHPERNILVRIVRYFIPLSKKKQPKSFFVYERGKWMMTSLFLVHLTIETTDVIFALDSIPAIFAITTDSFIIYTSNIFAILGLRSLYFVLVGYFHKLRYFKYGLAAILVFIGVKMLLAEVVTVSLPLSLSIVVAILALTTVFSLRSPKTSPS